MILKFLFISQPELEVFVNFKLNFSEFLINS